MKKLISILLACSLMFSSAVSIDAAPTDNTKKEAPVTASVTVEAPAAILIDSKSGRVLYEKNADEKHFPASTTKIMTAILAIEHGGLDDTVTIPNDISKLIEKDSNTIQLQKGEEVTLEQLVYAMMLESANDAAVAIAQYLTGKTGPEALTAFSEKMNDKAKALGATNTNFVTPNGLDSKTEEHLTTARDLALIAKYAMTLPKFREVVATLNYTIPATNKTKEPRTDIVNSNRMIWEKNVAKRYDYCIGIKTGYTVKAKNCFVAAAEKDGTELISVVLNSTKGSIYDDAKTMFEYGFNNYTNQVLVSVDKKIKDTVKVEKGKEKTVGLSVANEVTALLAGKEIDAVKSKVEIPTSVKAPVKKGDIIGSITYSLDGKEIGRVNLLAKSTIELKRFSFFRFLLTLIVLIALILVLWIGFVAAYRKRNKGKKRYLIKRKKNSRRHS